MIYVLVGFVLILQLMILRRLGNMATFAEVQTSLATLSADVDTKLADITSKVEAIEAGQGTVGATPEQLDTLVGTISTLNSKVNAYVLPAPAPAPTV